MNFLDTVMSGSIGPIALGAIAVGSSFFGSILFFMIGVLMAIPPVVAQCDGAGERHRIGAFFRQAVWVALGLVFVAWVVMSQAGALLHWLDVEEALVPTVLAYLDALAWGIPGLSGFLALRFLCEGIGQTRPTLYFGFFGLVLNFVGNYVLMYGYFGLPALGAVGCGYATAIVWSCQCVGLLILVRRSFAELAIFERFDLPHLRPIARLLGIGMPIGVALFMEASLFTTVALLMGSLGTVIVAGHQVALNFVSFTFMVPLGIGLAMTVRVGNAVGRRDPVGVRGAALSGFAMTLVTQVASASVMILLPRVVTAIYTDDPAVVAVAVELLFLAAIFQLSDGLQVCSAGALRGLKDTTVPMFLTTIAYWAIGVPMGYHLCFSRGLGARGLWMGLIGGLTVAALLLTVRFWRLAWRLEFKTEAEAR